MFFFDTCNAVAAREDRKPKYWRLGRRHFGLSLTLWRHTVKHNILNMTCDCWFPCSYVYWSLVKATKIVWESQVIDSSSITQSEALWVWRCDVTTSNSIQDGGALVVNILVFDLRLSGGSRILVWGGGGGGLQVFFYLYVWKPKSACTVIFRIACRLWNIS